MESLLNEYANIIQKIDVYENEEGIENDVREEIEKYKNDFMDLNIHVQTLRSQNVNLLDEIDFKNKKISDIDQMIQQKTTLINFLDNKLKNK